MAPQQGALQEDYGPSQSGLLVWVAVKELKLSYHNVYIHIVIILVSTIEHFKLNSLSAAQLWFRCLREGRRAAWTEAVIFGSPRISRHFLEGH